MAKFRKLVLDVAPLALVLGAAAFEANRQNQQARAAQTARRHRPWKDILLATWREFSADRGTMVAAGITFYTLLAIFPGLAAFVSLYGLFSDVGQVQQHLRVAAFLLPPDALDLIGHQMLRLAASQKGGLTIAFAIGLLTSIWSANGAVTALMAGLNAAYEENEGRSLVRQTLTSLAFTLGLILFGLAATTALGAAPVIAARFGPSAGSAVAAASYPALIVALFFGLALLYRYGPSRQHCDIHWFSWGAVAAIGLWLIVSALFQVYVGNFAHYDRVYGSFGAIVGFIMWLYLSNIIVLLGAELNAELEGPPARR